MSKGYSKRTCKLEDYIPFQRKKPKKHQAILIIPCDRSKSDWAAVRGGGSLQ